MTGSNGQLTFNIPDAIYSSKTCTGSDPNLTTENIKDQVAIFGVTGNYTGDVCSYYPATGQTFTDNENGTISDPSTHLMWVKQPELIVPGEVSYLPSNQVQEAWGDISTYCGGGCADISPGVLVSDSGTFYVSPTYISWNGTFIPSEWRETIWTTTADALDSPATMSYLDAISACNNLDYAGYSNWRLPEISELQTIIFYQLSDPAIKTDKFPNTQSGTYWSSTTLADYPGYAWFVNFSNGNVGFVGKANGLYVRCVRQY